MMNFLKLFSRNKPKIKQDSSKKEGFSGWIKCSHCNEMMHSKELQENLCCCPKCQFHYPFPAFKRIQLLADEGSFQEYFTDLRSEDPLEFVDTESYADRLIRAQKKTGREDAFYAGCCLINDRETALGVMDFEFMAGSMGSVVGEKITRLIELAIEKELPVVLVCASGGARMQESAFSLMQMAKTSAALALLAEAGLPYLSILTNPTLGGVTASFASLADLVLAEPDALIGFAGPRVVEQTIRQKLPPTAQKSEFLLEKGMIDGIVSRREMKEKISFFLDFLMGTPKKSPTQEIPHKHLTLPDKLQNLMKLGRKKKESDMMIEENITS